MNEDVDKKDDWRIPVRRIRFVSPLEKEVNAELIIVGRTCLPSNNVGKGKESLSESATYHTVVMAGVARKQRRKTLFYSNCEKIASFEYSGASLLAEKQTPQHIQDMMDAIPKLFGDEAKDINTCLVNYYPTRAHTIGAHSDDTSQMLKTKNVYCLVEGEASRKMEFVDRKTSVMYRVEIPPNSWYAMVGDDFQRLYTHALPEEDRAVFDHCSAMFFKNDDESNNNKTPAERADWLKANREKVRVMLMSNTLNGGGGKNKKRKRITMDDFDRWSEERVSYTFRAFAK